MKKLITTLLIALAISITFNIAQYKDKKHQANITNAMKVMLNEYDLMLAQK